MKNNFIKTAIIGFFLSSFSLLPIPVWSGNGGVSGGDPRVSEFLSGAQAFCDWIEKDRELFQFTSTCRWEVSDLYASVNDNSREARIYFDDKVVSDSNGVPKDITTNIKTRRLHGSFARWDSESYEQRMKTVSMEMALLLGIPRRYNLANKYSQSYVLGSLDPDATMWNFPTGVRFIATRPIEMMANSGTITILNGRAYGRIIINNQDVGQPDGIPRCVIQIKRDSPKPAVLSEFTTLAQSPRIGPDSTWISYNIVTPRHPDESSDRAFSCSQGNFGPGQHQVLSTREFLRTMGGLFHIVLPTPEKL